MAGCVLRLGCSERPRRRRPWHTDPLVVTSVPEHRRGARRRGPDLHHRWDRRHVGAEACRSASGRRYDLLLVFVRRLLVHGCALLPAVAREHAPVRPRHSLVRRRHDRTNGETTALAWLDPAAHCGHGHLVHLAAHGVLRRQRTTSAAMAVAAAAGTLAPTQPRRSPSSCPGPETSSAQSPRRRVMAVWARGRPRRGLHVPELTPTTAAAEASAR